MKEEDGVGRAAGAVHRAEATANREVDLVVLLLKSQLKGEEVAWCKGRLQSRGAGQEGSVEVPSDTPASQESRLIQGRRQGAVVYPIPVGHGDARLNLLETLLKDPDEPAMPDQEVAAVHVHVGHEMDAPGHAAHAHRLNMEGHEVAVGRARSTGAMQSVDGVHKGVPLVVGEVARVLADIRLRAEAGHGSSFAGLLRWSPIRPQAGMTGVDHGERSRQQISVQPSLKPDQRDDHKMTRPRP